MRSADRVRTRLLLALGLVAPACGPATPTTTTPTTAASSSSSVATKSTKSDDGPTVVGENDPNPVQADPAGTGCGVAFTRCQPAGEKGTSSYPVPFDACAYDYYGDGGEYYDRERFSIRESKRQRIKGDADACCYRLERQCYNNGGGNYYGPVPGRPLRDASTGQGLLADARAREDWASAVGRLDVVSMSIEARRALADAWLADAAEEHASIGAFSVVSLQLLALGAPADLLVGVHAAACDEIDHARLSYAVASAYAGSAHGPSSLDVSRAAIGADVVRFACETFRDGCYGETTASLRAREASRLAKDPAIASLLARIADDEERHAELAWRMLAWAIRVGGDAVVQAIHELARSIDRDADLKRSASELDLSGHGVLNAATRASIAGAAFDEVVVPCLAALVGSPKLREQSAPLA